MQTNPRPALAAVRRTRSVPKLVHRDQATRSREAREKLLAAAIDVLLDKGYAGLTTKEVALRAGLSNGALMHHYENKEELIVAATAAVYDESLERARKSAGTQEALEDPIDYYAADLMAVYFDWPFVAALEVAVVARTDPSLMARIRPVMDRFWTVRDRLWLDVLAKAGYAPDQAQMALALTLNVVRGLAVHNLWNDGLKESKALVKQWLDAAAGLFPRAARRRRKTVDG
jgi:AcrR family transcriptional regulator